MSIMKSWEGLKIPFEKIDVATEKFKTCGYGWVYKGVLSIDGKDTMVAVKRLNEQFGQGLKEFLTEIQLLSGQQHPNLISLLGYCDDERRRLSSMNMQRAEVWIDILGVIVMRVLLVSRG
ncbi:serine-threonine/tyrosine-protein kinase catalytic domain-containing protein [Tanacetum coccineum]